MRQLCCSLRTKVHTVLVVLGCFALAGCPSSCKKPQETVETGPLFKGETVKIGVPAGLGFANAWEVSLQEWSVRTGAEPRLEEFATPGASESFATNSSDQRALAESGDLVLIPFNRLADLTAEESLALIPKTELSETQLNWTDVFRGLREKVVAVHAGPAAVPLSAPVLVCYYRRDLLEKAGLQPPESWEAYQELLDRLEIWAPGLTAAEPWGEGYRATMFLARAVSAAQHPGHLSLFFDIETGEPLIDGPAFVRGLEKAQTAIAKMPREVLNFDPAACRAEILSGKAALAIALETGPGNPPLPCGPVSASQPAGGTESGEKKRASRVEGIQIGFCRLPGAQEVYNTTLGTWESAVESGFNRTTLTGFGGLCAGVSAKSSPRQAQAAWNLLVELTMSEMVASFPPGTIGLSRESQIGQADAWSGQELNPAEAAQYAEIVAQALRDRQIVAELPVLGAGRFRQALTANLGKALTGETPPAEALTGAAAAWREIAKQLGVEKVRDSYRRSLGLRAREE